MQIKASELRRNLFSVLDHCIESGEPVEVERRNGVVEIRPQTRRRRVDELIDRPGVLIDGETLDSFTPAEWSP
ncbi:MAG: type II toxin-antitoxin system Phd/YefM family antitoxin [Spirochaetaceae bacterium]|nr:MAG: type II toxin-antitoxin system Phd/YefM family antitoxin [Spirochaetaceae bacterium]